MSQIIKDSYYLIGLYQEKFKEINGAKLTNLLYLLDYYLYKLFLLFYLL